MISAKFLWGNVLLGGKLQIGAKNSNFEIFESALYMKSVSMPLMKNERSDYIWNTGVCVRIHLLPLMMIISNNMIQGM